MSRVGNIKIMSVRSPFFPSLPSLLFSLSCGFEAVRSHQNLGCGVVRVKTSKFSFNLPVFNAVIEKTFCFVHILISHISHLFITRQTI